MNGYHIIVIAFVSSSQAIINTKAHLVPKVFKNEFVNISTPYLSLLLLYKSYSEVVQ